MATLGAHNFLPVLREASPGLYLDGQELGEILLPRRYIPRTWRLNEKIEVFVYRDSEDRLVATTERPLATVGEFACLRVVTVNDRVGAFLDWGLTKDLLLPFREQEQPVRTGQRVVVFVMVDPKSERIVATTRLHRHLSHEPPSYRTNDVVSALITGATPLGFPAIVDRRHTGMLFRDAVPSPLQIGQELKAFVRAVRPNGQIDLSLDAAGYSRVTNLTDQILQALEAARGMLELDDDSPPELIRRKFGVSKKAFKQALGRLYKSRRIRFTNPGVALVENGQWSPGN